MKLKMNQNSLFAMLLRSPWWVSAGVAAALFTAGRIVLPEQYGLYAFFAALPFLVIAVHVAWKQLRAPSQSTIATAVETLRAMSWGDFSAAVEAAYQGDGYTVTRLAGAGADFELEKGGRTTLVSCKRWKVARTGVEPLRELDAARAAREAHEALYIATGEVTENARSYAAEKRIQVLQDMDLMRLVRGKLPKS
ncbi:MAG: restriction endonuclease [Proteobacteria bacterium]|nr:restriction endonuclease [Pseudomonadota bacterium]